MAQRMHGHALRLTAARIPVQRLGKALGGIRRQPRDQIGVDIGQTRACRARSNAVIKLLHRVAAADGLQHTVCCSVCGLMLIRGTPPPRGWPRSLSSRHRIRPAGLHRKFPHGGADQSCAPPRIQHCRACCSADSVVGVPPPIYTVSSRSAELARNPRRLLELPLQQLHIGRNQPPPSATVV